MRVVVFASLLACVGCLSDATSPGDNASPRPITAKSADGTPFSWSQVKGSPVLVHFWATWCAPCVKEFPEVVALARKLEPKGVKVLAISLDKTWEDARGVLGKVGAFPSNFVSVLDGTLKTGEAWGSFQFPETYLVSKDGVITDKWVGPQDWKRDEMFAKLTSGL